MTAEYTGSRPLERPLRGFVREVSPELLGDPTIQVGNRHAVRRVAGSRRVDAHTRHRSPTVKRRLVQADGLDASERRDDGLTPEPATPKRD